MNSAGSDEPSGAEHSLRGACATAPVEGRVEAGRRMAIGRAEFAPVGSAPHIAAAPHGGRNPLNRRGRSAPSASPPGECWGARPGRAPVTANRSTVLRCPPVETTIVRTGSVALAKATSSVHAALVPPAGRQQDIPSTPADEGWRTWTTARRFSGDRPVPVVSAGSPARADTGRHCGRRPMDAGQADTWLPSVHRHVSAQLARRSSMPRRASASVLQDR